MALPNTSVALPNNSVALPKSTVALPNSSVALPNSSVALPNNSEIPERTDLIEKEVKKKRKSGNQNETKKDFNCKRCKSKFKNRKKYIYHSCNATEEMTQTEVEAQQEQATGSRCSSPELGSNESDDDTVGMDTEDIEQQDIDIAASNEDPKSDDDAPITENKDDEILSKNNKVSSKKNKKSKVLQCDLCNKQFTVEKSFKKHSFQHQYDQYRAYFTHEKDGNTYTCKLCKTIFRRQDALFKHLKVHESTNFNENFPCSLCSKVLTTEAGYKSHMLRHLPNEEKRYHCDICGLGFPVLGDVQRHKLYLHSDKKDFVCHMCGKAYKQRKELTVGIWYYA